MIINPELAKQMTDQLSKLEKMAEQKGGGIETSPSPIDRLSNAFKEKALGVLPRSGGEWSGEPGNSEWKPTPSDKPSKNNDDGKTWEELMEKHDIDVIPFKDGEPDFSEISKGNVEIDDFSTKRYGAGGNFDQADAKLAEQRGCSKEEVVKWKGDNDYTWHEKQDCKTMQKVPRDIHSNVPHTGGVSVAKAKLAETATTKTEQ